MDGSTQKYLIVLLVLLITLGIADRVYLNYRYPKIIQVNEYEKLQEARSKWESASISAYKMSYEPVRGLYDCEYTVYSGIPDAIDISNREECNYFFDVRHMFDVIEDHLINENCGVNGCQCDGRVHVFADYEPVYGYPIKYTLNAIPKTAKPDWRTRLKFRRVCTLKGVRYPPYVITQFEVVPQSNP